MKRRGRPPKVISTPRLEHQEEQSGSTSSPHESIPPVVQQAQAQQTPLPNTPAQQVVQHQVPLPAQEAQSAASVQVQPQPSVQQQLSVQQTPPVQQQQLPAVHHQSQPQAAIAPNAPVPAAVPAPAVSVACVDPMMMAQMMQLQTTLLQTLLAREQAHVPLPAPPQEPKVGTIRDFNSFSPPVFTGYEEAEDADYWLRRIHNLLLASHIPEADMVEAARTKMDKMAGKWIESELTKRGNVMTWAEFKHLFTQKFIPPSSQRMMIKKFVALTQGSGDVTDYTREFEILRPYAAEMLPTEELRMEWYINGLSSQLRPLVRACRPTTLLEAQQSALQMEQDAAEAKENKPVSHKRPASQINRGGASVPVKTATTSFQSRPAVSTASVTQEFKPAVTCIGCGKRGHKVSECWWKNRKCFKCGSADHMIAECPILESRGDQTVSVAQAATSAARGRTPVNPAVHPASGLGRGSGSAPAHASGQRRASLPTQSTEFRQNGGAQSRGKRGLYSMTLDPGPADPEATGDNDQEDPILDVEE